MMAWAYVGLIALDFAAMVATLVPLWRMAPWVRRPGIGRILFFSLLTLKVWVALVLGWFTLVLVAASVVPLRAWRNWVYLSLIAYIGVQAVGVSVALWRWRRAAKQASGVRRVRQNGIPDD